MKSKAVGQTSADLVFASLKERIKNNVWYPGDYLPSESDLAEEYHVSRVTIRTALNRLSSLGLIKTRPGGGSYVIKFDFYNLIGDVSEFISANISYQDVATYRTMIESAAIDIIAQKPILSKYLKQLQNCIARMKKANSAKDNAYFTQADYDFHLCICEMTENTMFIYAYQLLISVMLNYLEEHYRRGAQEKEAREKPGMAHVNYNEICIKDHEFIAKSLEEGNYDAARRALIFMATDPPNDIPLEILFQMEQEEQERH